MRTTLDIDRGLLEETARIANEKSLSLAVTKALAEYVRRRKLEDLKKLIGSNMLVDNWKELEKLELAEARGEIA